MGYSQRKEVIKIDVNIIEYDEIKMEENMNVDRDRLRELREREIKARRDRLDSIYNKDLLESIETDEFDSLGKYGKLRRHYLITSRSGYYRHLLAIGKLKEHLEEIDKVSNAMENELLGLLISKEKFENKADNDIKISDEKMYTIARQIEEVIFTEVIFM